jgi:mitogen-activated protein kinase 8 interacting protein 3
MNNAQLSFHGYQDAVKFFVAVPGQPPSKILHDDQMNLESLKSISSTDTSSLPFGDILVVSGGDGYIDFRVGNIIADTNDETSNSNRHMSYLIVWHLGST